MSGIILDILWVSTFVQQCKAHSQKCASGNQLKTLRDHVTYYLSPQQALLRLVQQEMLKKKKAAVALA